MKAIGQVSLKLENQQQVLREQYLWILIFFIGRYTIGLFFFLYYGTYPFPLSRVQITSETMACGKSRLQTVDLRMADYNKTVLLA